MGLFKTTTTLWERQPTANEKKTTTIKKKKEQKLPLHTKLYTQNYHRINILLFSVVVLLFSLSLVQQLMTRDPLARPFLTAPPPRPPSISKQSKNYYYYYYLLMWKRKKKRACDDSCCCSECHHCWSINKKGLRPAVKKPQLRAGLWF